MRWVLGPICSPVGGGSAIDDQVPIGEDEAMIEVKINTTVYWFISIARIET